MTPTTEEELATIKEWLRVKHSTLWGTFDVSDDEGRTRAGTWFAAELNDLIRFVEDGPQDGAW